MSWNLHTFAPESDRSAERTWADVQQAALKAGLFCVGAKLEHRENKLVGVEFTLSDVDGETLARDDIGSHHCYQGYVEPAAGDGLNVLTGTEGTFTTSFFISTGAETEFDMICRFLYSYFSDHLDHFLWPGYEYWAYTAGYVVSQQDGHDPQWLFKNQQGAAGGSPIRTWEVAKALMDSADILGVGLKIYDGNTHALTSDVDILTPGEIIEVKKSVNDVDMRKVARQTQPRDPGYFNHDRRQIVYLIEDKPSDDPSQQAVVQMLVNSGVRVAYSVAGLTILVSPKGASQP